MTFYQAPPPIPFDELAALLRARPEWQWVFRLGDENANSLIVEVMYVCPCALQERLYTRQEFFIHDLERMKISPQPLHLRLTEVFTAATDKNIEAHTATWERVELSPPLHEQFAWSPEQQRASMMSTPSYERCHRCRTALTGAAYIRHPGIQPPGRPSPAPDHYCLSCGGALQAEH